MSAPYCTSLPAAPALGTDGLLHWSNGGWACDSGPITNYISHIYADSGVNICGAVPLFRYDGAKPFDVPGRDVWAAGTLSLAPGVWATLDLYAVTHSVYVGAYDWWEVGNRMGADPTKTASVRFQIPSAVPPPPPTQPNIPAAQADLLEALNVLHGCYAWDKPTAASHAAVKQAAGLIVNAQAFLRGENP